MGQIRVMSCKNITFVASATLLFSFLGLASSGFINNNAVKTTTLHAVPLEGSGEEITTEDSLTTDDYVLYNMREATTEVTPRSTEETTRLTATPEIPPSSTTVPASTYSPAPSSSPPSELPNGMIAWSPYSKDSKAKPITLPNYSGFGGIFLPNQPQPKGRWISRDIEKANIINTTPAFALPLVAIIDQSEENQEKVKEKYHRSKRATSTQGLNPYVALCGGTFRELYGNIQSPDYPLYYPNNKKCTYDIEVPADHTIKITCDNFLMQGGGNCTHDFMMIDYTGDKTFANGQKFCGTDSPVMVTNGTRMTIKFESDDLFRYQGFSCRYRALMSNGIAVPGSFGNATDTTKPKYNGNNFLQVVQCPSLGGNVNVEEGSSSSTAGASLYSGMWNGRCGSQNLPPLNRIVGGYSTVEFEYPWIAAVLRTCGDKYCHICGATIISEEWILTGAHCMQKVAMEELGILVGDHNLYTISTSQKFIKVKEKVIHPDYYTLGNVTSPLNNDIGLLRLEYPIIFTSQISPLCLPALGETGFGGSAYGTGNTTMLDTTGLGIVGTNATVLGWGMINDSGDFSTALRGVEVEILDNKACNDLFGIMTENMMCTSGVNGRGTCFGDSGGPAIVTQPDGSYVQVGILSFGALEGCEKGYPSGQVLVHKYIDWIQSVTGVAFGTSSG